jgi:outer membrane translocation and assembly module TamA
VTGILFADAGWAGTHGAPRVDDVAVGIGYGLRVRVPWVQQVGLDVGVPLSPGVLDESFHVNVSLGWTY